MQYVILHHTGHGEPHYDLLVAVDEQGPLLAWRTPVWPLEDGVPLTHLRDHRRHYLTYQGPVSGDRGEVRRMTEGMCEVEAGPPYRVRFEAEPQAWELAETARRVS